MITSTSTCPQFQERRPWLFGRVPDGYWDSHENRVEYLDWLGERLGLVNINDWYQVRNFHFIRNHGGTLLSKVYDSSVLVAMLDYEPQYEWLPWLFAKKPKGYWQVSGNRHSFMQWLELTLPVETEDDWYRVTRADFVENGGAGLLVNFYQGSVLSALREYRPDRDWMPWLFPKVPCGFWNSSENRLHYFRWLGERLRFHSINDWTHLTVRELRATGGAGLFSGFYSGSLKRVRNEVVSMRLCE
jgi:hypothetical protein